MKENSRLFIVSALLMVISTGLLFFQNCSKAKFTQANSSISPKPTPPVDDLSNDSLLKSVPITGRQMNAFEPLKIFLIVDFSPSMVNEIAKVRNALNLFLIETKPKQALEVYLFNIHGYSNSVIYQATAANALGEGFSAVLKTPIAQMSTNPNMANSDFVSTKTQFFNLFDNYAVTYTNPASSPGETHEVGLCQIVRLLKTSNLINPSDKVSFILVTDEDDESADYCFDKFPHTVVQNLTLKFDFELLEIKYNITGKRPSDAGLQINETRVDKIYSIACPANGGVPELSPYCAAAAAQVACPSTLITHLKNSVGYVGFSEISAVHSCTYSRRTLLQQPGNMYSNNIIGVSMLDVKSGASFQMNGNGPVFSNYQSYFQSQYQGARNFTVPVLSSTTMGLTKILHSEFAVASQINTRLTNLIAQKVNPNNVSVNFIVYNPADAACTVNDRGALGSKYLNFILANAANPLYKKESVCQADYHSVLAHTNNLINWISDSSYALPPSKISKVVILKSGVRKVLIPSQYVFQNGQIILNFSVDLSQGSVLEFYENKKIK